MMLKDFVDLPSVWVWAISFILILLIALYGFFKCEVRIEEDWPVYQPALDLLSEPVKQETNKEHKQMRKFTELELLADIGIDPKLSSRSEYESGVKLICIAFQLTGGEKDTLKAAYENGPIEDGDVPSKVSRDALVGQGLMVRIATRNQGILNACTNNGYYAYSLIKYMSNAK